MAFKSVKTYNEEKFGGLFLLRNDGDYADVIFLYESLDDVLVADTHYIKSADYSGYVHCCGRGCPACSKGIRVQTKLFIPLYNLTTNQVEFWDRSIRFEQQLSQDVFANFPNPSEFVYRITRKGVAGDVNTVYQISAIGKNSVLSYADILKINNISFPAYYENICKDMSAKQISDLLSGSAPAGTASENYEPISSMPNYQITPRAVTPGSSNIAPPVDTLDSNGEPFDTLDDEEPNF